MRGGDLKLNSIGRHKTSNTCIDLGNSCVRHNVSSNQRTSTKVNHTFWKLISSKIIEQKYQSVVDGPFGLEPTLSLIIYYSLFVFGSYNRESIIVLGFPAK